jgi:hypothetical protein
VLQSDYAGLVPRQVMSVKCDTVNRQKDGEVTLWFAVPKFSIMVYL